LLLISVEEVNAKHAVAVWDLGRIYVFAFHKKETNKICVQLASRRTFLKHKAGVRPALVFLACAIAVTGKRVTSNISLSRTRQHIVH